MDTIFALASARGKAGVSVIRLSGPRAHEVGAVLSGRLPPVRQASVRNVTANGTVLDQALVIAFAKGQSFTGEETVEFHVHGSVAVVSALLRVLADMPGCRSAEPGEFTRRALLNGMLDLTQVEGLADLIEAETEAQRRQALRVMSGDVGRRAADWRQRMVRAAALIEATIDFADEDVPVDVRPEVLDLISGLLTDLRNEVRGASARERLRQGFEVAILGAPNVGKSTLLNRLAGREAAITSDIAGTTRDVIEVRMDLSGLPVTFLDTAGLRETDDPVESIGISRAVERAEQADIRVVLLGPEGVPQGLQLRADDIVLRSKIDLEPSAGEGISARTGAGVDLLIATITDRLGAGLSDLSVVMHERHRIAIERAIQALESARNRIDSGFEATELAAEDLRSAIRALEVMIGRIGVENLLDEIFASFCIGK